MTMKCKYCGADLKIEDEVCPYCGQENPDAAEHRRHMKRFKREFESARQDVYGTTNRFTGWTVRLTLLSVLLMLNVALLFGNALSWQIGRKITQMKVRSEWSVHTQAMDTLEEEGRFLELYQYSTAKSLFYDSRYSEYRPLLSMCSSYSSIYRSLVHLLDSKETYRTPQELLEGISTELDWIYKYRDVDTRWDESAYTETHLAAMEEMEAEVHLLLKAYCHVTDEELERFPGLSPARRQIILEGGMGLDEP